MAVAKTVRSGNRVLTNFISNYSIALVLIVAVVVMVLISNNFFTASNLFNMLRAVSIFGIMAFGMTYVIIGGGLDLSIGSIMSLCMINAILLQPRGIPVAVVTTILIGVAAGAVNGVLIGTVGANALIVTLATQILYQAATLIYSRGFNQLGDPNSPFNVIGHNDLLGVPILVWMLLLAMVVSHLVLSRTTYGRKLYITGSNPVAARMLGIRTGTVVMTTYIVSGLSCSIAALMLSSRLTSAQPNSGVPYLFDVFTAVILGGTSLSGGKGNIANTIIGILLLGVISNGLMILAISYSDQQMIKGIILVVAVIYDSFNRERQIAR